MSILDNILEFFKTPKIKKHRRVWAIGDIQGCYSAFRRLLKEIEFDPELDCLWIAGDLVNRGQDSLETLEYLYSIRDRVHIVLGNHDITLLAIYWGIKKSNPTIDPILQSPNVDKLIEWIRTLPFVYYDKELGFMMVHAGIPREFGLEQSLYYSDKLQSKLQGENAKKWLTKKLSKGINGLDESNNKNKKNRYALNAFTRLRYCYIDGRANFEQKGKPTAKTYRDGLLPWFELRRYSDTGAKIIFGHWSTLGYLESDTILSLDTGCVWRGKLSAKRIDIPNGRLVQIDCPEGNEIKDSNE